MALELLQCRKIQRNYAIVSEALIPLFGLVNHSLRQVFQLQLETIKVKLHRPDEMFARVEWLLYVACPDGPDDFKCQIVTGSRNIVDKEILV